VTASFVWYDLETFGRDPRRTRIAQFAGIRTDAELKQVGAPESFYCQPALDLLPSPAACLITGLSPLDLRQRGLLEADAMQRIAAVFGEPDTCGVGWNSMRFDDEFLRHGFYRNFIDPYRREYDQGNSRWDLMDFARLCHAVRPEGIRWPQREDGAPSFRLEHLASANDVEHGAAHDALSDVQATLGLARRLRSAQPKLWDYHLGFRNKARARPLLDATRQQPVLHVSGRFPAERGCAAIILPLADHPAIGNQVIACDLQDDPEDWCSLPIEELQDRLFSPRDSLPDGVSRIPLKVVHLNRCPALVDLRHVTDDELGRLGIDRQRCLAHARRLLAEPGLAERCRLLFARTQATGAADVDQALYDALPERIDTRLHAQIRVAEPEQLGSFQGRLRDPRGDQLLFRYRARNWPQTLDADERERWLAYRQDRLALESGLSEYSFSHYFAEIDLLADSDDASRSPELLADLRLWGKHLQTFP
jgi:exodeoxyribonuclease-1